MRFSTRNYRFLFFFGMFYVCCCKTQYVKLTGRVTWAEADGDCRSRYGRLLVLDHPEKMSAFREQIPLASKEELWTGGYREHSPWIWIEGCFASENLDRSDGHIMEANEASVCATMCRDDTFAALTGNKCYCFEDLRELRPLDARKCNIQCPGSSSEVCGGRHAVSVYSIGGVKGYKESITVESLSVHEESRQDWKNCVYILKHGKSVWMTADCRKQFPFLCKIYKEGGTITEYRSPSDKVGSWTEANAMCREEGGTLADLHANNMKAVSALPKHSEYWVGLYRNTSWQWHTEDTEVRPQWCTAVSIDDVGDIHFKTKSCSLPYGYVCQIAKSQSLATTESQMVVYVACGTVAWLLAILTIVFIIYVKKRRGCRRRSSSEDNTRINSNYFDLDEEPVSRQSSHSYVNEACQANGASSKSSKSARGLAAEKQQEQKSFENSQLSSCQGTECSRYYTVNGNEYATVVTGKTANDALNSREGACGTSPSSPSRSSTSTDPDYDHVWDSLGKHGKKPARSGAVRHYENSSKAIGNVQRVNLPERKENDYETFPARETLKPSEEIIFDKRQLGRMRSNSM